MSEYFPVRGICLACQSGSKCDVHQGRAFLQCDQFKGPAGYSINVSVRLPSYYGLCRDCEIRAICKDAAQSGGRWQCEQFR